MANFYGPKRAPSVPPSYASKSPTMYPMMTSTPPAGGRTPYEQELEDLSDRTGPRPRQAYSDRDNHGAWKQGADNYFYQRPSPPSSAEKVYKRLCCGSLIGCALWIFFVFLAVIGVAVGIAFAIHQNNTKPDGAPLAQSTPISGNPSVATVTVTPMLSGSSLPQVSTTTSVSVSTFYSSPPSTVTATTTASTTATETETLTTTTSAVSTTISMVSGTIITVTERTTSTAVSVSGSVSTDKTTVITTAMTTLTTAPSVSTVIVTTTPVQPTTVTVSDRDRSPGTVTATTTATTTSISTDTTTTSASTTVTNKESSLRPQGGNSRISSPITSEDSTGLDPSIPTTPSSFSPSTQSSDTEETSAQVSSTVPTCPIKSDDDHWPDCKQCPNWTDDLMQELCVTGDEFTASCRCPIPCTEDNPSQIFSTTEQVTDAVDNGGGQSSTSRTFNTLKNMPPAEPSSASTPPPPASTPPPTSTTPPPPASSSAEPNPPAAADPSPSSTTESESGPLEWCLETAPGQKSCATITTVPTVVCWTRPTPRSTVCSKFR